VESSRDLSCGRYLAAGKGKGELDLDDALLGWLMVVH
jgi:hypothetical protein